MVEALAKLRLVHRLTLVLGGSQHLSQALEKATNDFGFFVNVSLHSVEDKCKEKHGKANLIK